MDSGHVGLFIATPGQLNIQPRIDGAIAAIKASGKPITYELIATGATIDEELPKIKAYYLGNQSLKGMFAVDAGSTQCIGQVMKEYGLAAKGIHGGGFDLVPRTLEYINDGILSFTIDQQPYLQGFYTVMEMVMYLASGGLVGPAEINTGLKFVTKDTVDAVSCDEDALRRQPPRAADRAAFRSHSRINDDDKQTGGRSDFRENRNRAAVQSAAQVHFAGAGGQHRGGGGYSRHRFRDPELQLPDQRQY